MKEHVHEIEVKYGIQKKKVDAIAAVLETLGFSFKSTTKVVDKWLKVGKDYLRLREEKKINKSKYFLSKKKTMERDDGVKNKCEAESKLDEFINKAMLKLAKQAGQTPPTVHKTRMSWIVTIGNRDYTAVIDHVDHLGEFSGYYFELETLVPFDVTDPKAKAAVKALAKKILKAAYKGDKDMPTTCELLSYRKMAIAYQAQLLRTKVKIKRPQDTQRAKKCIAKK